MDANTTLVPKLDKLVVKANEFARFITVFLAERYNFLEQLLELFEEKITNARRQSQPHAEEMKNIKRRLAQLEEYVMKSDVLHPLKGIEMKEIGKEISKNNTKDDDDFWATFK